MATNEYQLAGFLPIIHKWRWPVLVVTGTAIILSVVISILLPDIYRSTTIFYPATLPNLSTTLNTEAVITGEKLELSMSSDDADRLISIGQSEPLLRTIIQKHKFTQRYGYSPTDTSEKVRQKVLDEFLYNYNIYQNNRSAVEVSFDDADKYLAARVANYIMLAIDSINQELTRENQQKLLNAYAQRHTYLQKRIEGIQAQLVAARRKYNIMGSASPDGESRPESRYLAEKLVQTEIDLRQARAALLSYRSHLPANHIKIITLQADVKGLEAALFALKHPTADNTINQDSYVAGTDEVSKLELIYAKQQEEYVKALQAYEDARISLDTKTSSMYVVQKATPASKKIRPIRWLIVLGATCLTFVLSVVAAAIAERLKVARQRALYV